MTLTANQRALNTARLGIMRLGAFRLGYSPNDVYQFDKDNIHVAYTDGKDALFGTSTGTVVPWGLGGNSLGVDEEN